MTQALCFIVAEIRHILHTAFGKFGIGKFSIGKGNSSTLGAVKGTGENGAQKA